MINKLHSLTIKVVKEGNRSDATEQPFWLSKEPFGEQFLKEPFFIFLFFGMRNALII